MNYQNNIPIRVNVMYETGKFRPEFINLAHIIRFYESDEYIVIELINNVKLKVCDITTNVLFEKFYR